MILKLLKEIKNKYLKEFNSELNGPLHDQDWFKDGLNKYHKDIDNLKQYHCLNCSEMWPSKLNHCLQCSIDPLKFSKLNDMVPEIDNIPNIIKKNLESLTMIEEMLISPILSVMSVFRLPNGALISRGFIANFSQDIKELTKILPRLPKDLPIIILKKKIKITIINSSLLIKIV